MERTKRKHSKPIKLVVGNTTVIIYTYRRPDGDKTFRFRDYSTGAPTFRNFSNKPEAQRGANRLTQLMVTSDAAATQLRNGDAAENQRLERATVDWAAGHVILSAVKSNTAARRLTLVPQNAIEWLRPYARKFGALGTRSPYHLHGG